MRSIPCIGISVFINQNQIEEQQRRGRERNTKKVLKLFSTIYLVCIKFHIYHWHPLVQLVEMFDHTMNSFRNILKNKIEIKFILVSC